MCLALFGLGISSFVSANATSAHPRLFVVFKPDRPVHQRLIQSLRGHSVGTVAGRIETINLTRLTQLVSSGQAPGKADLVVAIGTEVTQEIFKLALDSDVLSVAIPRLSYDQLWQRFSPDLESVHYAAIYLDQPLQRRLQFVKALLPDAKRIGVALGENTVGYREEIIRETENLRMAANIATVSDRNNLINTLDEILETSDVMLGIVDPLVFNRRSSRNILLTTYRWRIPLIGISSAYVRAGALGAVYSTPAQIGQQLAEEIERYSSDPKQQLSASQFPRYFDVEINYQVAESLGLFLVSEADAKASLLAAEKRSP